MKDIPSKYKRQAAEYVDLDVRDCLLELREKTNNLFRSNEDFRDRISRLEHAVLLLMHPELYKKERKK